MVGQRESEMAGTVEQQLNSVRFAQRKEVTRVRLTKTIVVLLSVSESPHPAF